MTLRYAISTVLLTLPGAVALTQPMAAARPAETLALPCNGCHGTNGVSQAGSTPSIAGLDPEYHYEVLRAFKEGRRASTIMKRISKGYKNYELRKIARYFALQDCTNSNSTGDEASIVRGHRLHDTLCKECHEDVGRHQDKELPRLAGQRFEYLLMQMRLYLARVEALPQPTEMAEELAQTGPGDLHALSLFYANVR